MLSVNATTSTTLLVSWEAPHLDDADGDLLYFSVSCNNENPSMMTTENPSIMTTEYSVSFPSLQPFTTYTCCVVATTTVGVSASSCLTQTTLEDSKTW